MNLELTDDEAQMLLAMISHASITPQGLKDGNTLPVMKLIVGLSAKLEELIGQVEVVDALK